MLRLRRFSTAAHSLSAGRRPRGSCRLRRSPARRTVLMVAPTEPTAMRRSPTAGQTAGTRWEPCAATGARLGVFVLENPAAPATRGHVRFSSELAVLAQTFPQGIDIIMQKSCRFLSRDSRQRLTQQSRTNSGVSSLAPCMHRMADHDMMGRALPAMPQPYAIPSAGSRQRHSSGAHHSPIVCSTSAVWLCAQLLLLTRMTKAASSNVQLTSTL